MIPGQECGGILVFGDPVVVWLINCQVYSKLLLVFNVARFDEAAALTMAGAVETRASSPSWARQGGTGFKGLPVSELSRQKCEVK